MGMLLSTMPIKERICHNAEDEKSLAQLTIKCRFEEFETWMNAGPREERMIKAGFSKLLRGAGMSLLVANGKEEENSGNIVIAVGIHFKGPKRDNGEELGATCHLYLVDGSGSKTDVGERRIRDFVETTTDEVDETYCWLERVSHERVKNALQADGSLVVVADVEVLVPYDLLLWPAKFSRFYGNTASSDCSIQIGGETIPTHKVFLMACSPVFEAMFTNPLMEESKSGVVQITDFQRSEPMRALVRYCYQGYLDDSTKDGDDAVEIFKLADKYLIDNLKAQFEDHFINERLSKENVIGMAVLADAHSAKELKEACTMLIAEEWDTICESTEWKRLEEEMPELAAELAEAATAEWKRLEEDMPDKSSSHKFLKKRAIQLNIKQKIDKFQALMDTTEPGEGELWSEGVSSELAPNVVWQLKIYPNGEREYQEGNIVVGLYLNRSMNTIKEDIDATCHIYLVDGSDGSKIDLLERRTRNFYGAQNYFDGRVSHDQVRKALHEDGSLLVAADLEFLFPAENLQRWSNKFLRFYGDSASSDCSIQIGGETIPAHKVFLMASSPVFEAMFTNPASEESKSGVVQITDFQRPEPMRELVRYCYTGFLDKATKDGDDAVEIFKLADKYCIYDLKAHLEEHFIKKRLSVENVIEMVVLADANSAKWLKNACTKLIAKEWDTISESNEWKRLEEDMPELAAELVGTVEVYFIKKRLSKENVIKMVVLADARSFVKLKKACIELIAKEWGTVSESANWKRLEEEMPELAAELAGTANAEE